MILAIIYLLSLFLSHQFDHLYKRIVDQSFFLVLTNRISFPLLQSLIERIIVKRRKKEKKRKRDLSAIDNRIFHLIMLGSSNPSTYLLASSSRMFHDEIFSDDNGKKKI